MHIKQYQNIYKSNTSSSNDRNLEPVFCCSFFTIIPKSLSLDICHTGVYAEGFLVHFRDCNLVKRFVYASHLCSADGIRMLARARHLTVYNIETSIKATVFSSLDIRRLILATILPLMLAFHIMPLFMNTFFFFPFRRY